MSSTTFNDFITLTRLFSRSLNPGRIDPTNSAWDDSRKPLVAVWEPVAEGGERFFTVNLHLIAKTGGTSFEGDSRPPVNSGIQQRTAQVTEVAVRRFSSDNIK